MILIKEGIFINNSDIEITFITSGGPGGQHVNKVATGAQLKFKIAPSPLPDYVKKRLFLLFRNRINALGELVITAKRYKSQHQNREDALNRLKNLILKATEKPKIRKKTKVSKSQKEKRLKAKKQRSTIKKNRGKVSFDDE